MRHRKSIRLKDYDYSSAGAYFVTICTRDRQNMLGHLEHDAVVLSNVGEIASDSLMWLAEQYTYTELDEHIIMPNHLHAIIILNHDTTRRGRSRPALPTKIKSLDQLIGAFKSRATTLARQAGFIQEETIWQRSYYDHIIRNEEDLYNIRCYIRNNPLNWMLKKDEYYREY